MMMNCGPLDANRKMQVDKVERTDQLAGTNKSRRSSWVLTLSRSEKSHDVLACEQGFAHSSKGLLISSLTTCSKQ